MIKPYHSTEFGQLYHGNCIEVMGEIDDKSLDLAVCDFPYEIDNGGGSFIRNRKYFRDIMNTGLSLGFSTEILTIMSAKLKKQNGYYFCNKNQFKQYIDYAYDNKYHFDLLMWHKTNPSPLCNNNFLPDTEFIMFIREKGVKLNVTYQTGSRYFVSNVEKNEFAHSTVKPVHIIERLITNSSNAGDIIIDPTCGSGTTAIACIRYKRRYIMIEKEEKYCAIAAKRIESELDQQEIEL